MAHVLAVIHLELSEHIGIPPQKIVQWDDDEPMRFRGT